MSERPCYDYMLECPGYDFNKLESLCYHYSNLERSSYHYSKLISPQTFQLIVVITVLLNDFPFVL